MKGTPINLPPETFFLEQLHLLRLKVLSGTRNGSYAVHQSGATFPSARNQRLDKTDSLIRFPLHRWSNPQHLRSAPPIWPKTHSQATFQPHAFLTLERPRLTPTPRLRRHSSNLHGIWFRRDACFRLPAPTRSAVSRHEGPPPA